MAPHGVQQKDARLLSRFRFVHECKGAFDGQQQANVDAKADICWLLVAFKF